MDLEFSREELNKIRTGSDKNWSRVGDSSAFGGVFKSPLYPGVVVKIQSGEYGTWRNETDQLFRAMEENDGVYEVPAIGGSGFHPDSGLPPGKNGFDPFETGLSFITQDEADFAEVAGAQSKKKHAKARALTDLYRKGIVHADDHSGNIKYNPKTDKAVLLDFGLARKADGHFGTGKRTEWIQDALKASDNLDMLDLFDEQHYELQQEVMMDPTNESKKADLEDWRRQGQEVALMTHPDIAPVNVGKYEVDTPASNRDAPMQILREGSKEWNKSPEFSSPEIPGTSWFDEQMKIIDGMRTPKPTKAWSSTPLRGALSVGAADLIPSRESIQTAYKKGPVAALKQHGEEWAKSLPVAAGIGFTAQASPIIATGAAYAAPGLVAVAGAEALDEVVKQQTGEGIVPKFRQAIGTEKRTGRVEGSPQEKLKEELDRIQNPPTITPTTRKPRRSPVSKTPFPDFAHRLRLAGDRFNPSKGEFGLSELIFGR